MKRGFVSALTQRVSSGTNLAKKKKAELVDAKENTKDGVLYYTFVFKAGDDKKVKRREP